jgi:hypothetical protein
VRFALPAEYLVAAPAEPAAAGLEPVAHRDFAGKENIAGGELGFAFQVGFLCERKQDTNPFSCRRVLERGPRCGLPFHFPITCARVQRAMHYYLTANA